MVSDETNFSEFVPSKADGVVDYNNPNNVIKLGWSGDSFTAADFTYALGLSNDKKIKDISKTEYKKWLGLNAVDNTADANKSVDYANRAGSIKDSYDGSTLNISYGAPALSYSDFTWMPVYDGDRTLKTANKNLFAQASHTHTKSQISDFPTSMPASDVYAWAKESTKPTYTKSEIGLGSVDNTADADKLVNYANMAGLIKDSNDGRGLKVSYSATDLPYSGFTWIAAYDGNTLKTINKNMFAQASHTHSEYAANDVVTISSSQLTSSTCKLWIKI